MNFDLNGPRPESHVASQRLARWLAARRLAFAALGLAAALAVTGYRLFIAQPGEAAWATCLWREVPTSTANWLAMDPPGQPPGIGEPLPGELLKARLLGACAAPLAPLGHASAAAPDWADLRAALADRYPARVADDGSDPRAFVCEVFFADDAALTAVADYDWGFGDFNSGPVIGRRSPRGVSRHYGQALTAANSVRFCRLIGPDGRPGRDRFQRAPLPDQPSAP